jgi:hypothetical protein
MKKSLFGIAAVAAVAGIIMIGANLEAAGPVAQKAAVLKAANGVNKLASHMSHSAAAATDLDYATGFEAADGFTARDGTCVQDNTCDALTGCTCAPFTGECGWINGQGSGPFPAPWGVSVSNQGIGMIEGHIDTVNPFSGQQHLRISKDVCDTTAAFSFATDARIPDSNTAIVGIVGPSTYSGQIALTHGLFGANVNWQPQSNSQNKLTTRTLFYFYGFFYILDDTGSGYGFVPVFTYWDYTGAYHEFSVHHDPCNGYICTGNADTGGVPPNPGAACTDDSDCKVCVGGDNDGAGCLGDFQCPGGGVCDGGQCSGRVDYYYDGNLLYTGSQWDGTSSEQFLIYTDNFPGNTDLDDLNIETGDPCPTTCGNLIVEGAEQCDGANDGLCPGRCVAPGGTGVHGEAECQCEVDGATCEDATPLPNGTTNVYSHGGWWTFTADSDAVAVNTCGSQNYDSALDLYTGSCDSLELLNSNDDCNIDDPVYGTGQVDPLAPCHPVSSPYESCFCWATTVGQQYWVNDSRVGFGATTNITLEKRQTCEAHWDNGACCDGYGMCTDDVAEGDCQAVGDQWVGQKLCGTDAVDCQTVLGACCDRAPGAGGACADGVLEADCQGQYNVFTLGTLCDNAPTCSEIKGACCNGFTGTCTSTIQSACQGLNMFWTEGETCGNVDCEPIPGACCNHVADDPLSTVGTCTDGVIQADCQGENLTWTKATLCANVDCDAIYPAIPTVSEWGIVVLALLLLVGAKVYFGRRESLA